MILSLTRYTARLALRIKNTKDLGQTTDWKQLQLVIQPPPLRKGCHVGGSPWYLYGCWPFHPTGIDLANPHVPDFPAIAIDAFEADEEGRIVFILDHRVHDLPNGRYMGTVRIRSVTPPINIPLPRRVIPGHLGAASRYTEDRYLTPCDAPPPVLIEPTPACDLFTFDIDLGPECAQHMVDQASVDMVRSSCGDDVEFCPTCTAGPPEPKGIRDCTYEEDLCYEKGRR